MAERMRSRDDCMPIIWLCITKYCPSNLESRLKLYGQLESGILPVDSAHSSPCWFPGWVVFFSGFSKRQGVPLN